MPWTNFPMIKILITITFANRDCLLVEPCAWPIFLSGLALLRVLARYRAPSSYQAPGYSEPQSTPSCSAHKPHIYQKVHLSLGVRRRRWPLPPGEKMATNIDPTQAAPQLEQPRTCPGIAPGIYGQINCSALRTRYIFRNVALGGMCRIYWEMVILLPRRSVHLPTPPPLVNLLLQPRNIIIQFQIHIGLKAMLRCSICSRRGCLVPIGGCRQTLLLSETCFSESMCSDMV